MTHGSLPRSVPPGFEPHFRSSPITDPWQPLYSRRLDDRVVIGLYAATCHTNARGLVHGGLITTLADNAMELSCAACYNDGRSLLTMNLTVDFLSAATIGQWMEFDTSFSKLGGSVSFAQCFVTAEGEPVARANAVFKASRPPRDAVP